MVLCYILHTLRLFLDALAKSGIHDFLTVRTASLMTHGRHTLGIECKGVLSNGVERMLVGNRVDVGLTGSTTNPMPPSLFPVKGANRYRPHGSEPPVAWIGQHPWFRPGWKILPTAQTPTVPAVSGVRVTTST